MLIISSLLGKQHLVANIHVKVKRTILDNLKKTMDHTNPHHNINGKPWYSLYALRRLINCLNQM